MSTNRVVPMWTCEQCSHVAEHLDRHGYCEACGSDSVTIDLGNAEVQLARIMRDIDITLGGDEATTLLAAVTKVLNEFERGSLGAITPAELAALQELYGALMGISPQN